MWYLDGNNLLSVALGTRKGGSRERLLLHLANYRLPSPCSVVFDGPPPREGKGQRRMGRLSVVYAAPRSADDVIASRVRPKDVVVTGDRDLALRCRDKQAGVVSPREFLSGLKPLSGKRTEKPDATDVNVEEWLEIFGGEDR